MELTKKQIRELKRHFKAEAYRKVALEGGGPREVTRRKRQVKKKSFEK